MGIRQQRRTHLDTIEFQGEMFKFVKNKIEGDVGFIKDEEESYEFFVLLSNSLLGQGPISQIIPQFEIGNVILPVGSDVHHFALQLMNVRSEEVVLQFHGRTFVVSVRDLWKCLWKYMLVLFPRAQTEALHMSREEWKYKKRTSGFEFNPEEKL